MILAARNYISPNKIGLRSGKEKSRFGCFWTSQWALEYPIQVPSSMFCSRNHPRIDLTTLFFTKIYLQNTSKAFSGHENPSLVPKQQNLKKPLLGGYP
jgi:hypothetical protein